MFAFRFVNIFKYDSSDISNVVERNVSIDEQGLLSLGDLEDVAWIR